MKKYYETSLIILLPSLALSIVFMLIALIASSDVGFWFIFAGITMAVALIACLYAFIESQWRVVPLCVLYALPGIAWVLPVLITN